MIEKLIESVGFEPGDSHEEDTGLAISMAAIDNVWVRQMHFDVAGKKNSPHYHHHDHASLLAAGSVKVVVDGVETVFKAPCMILVVKDKLHYMEALEPNTVVYCVHGIRDNPDGNLVSPEMIPSGLSGLEVARKYGPFAIKEEYYEKVD